MRARRALVATALTLVAVSALSAQPARSEPRVRVWRGLGTDLEPTFRSRPEAFRFQMDGHNRFMLQNRIQSRLRERAFVELNRNRAREFEMRNREFALRDRLNSRLRDNLRREMDSRQRGLEARDRERVLLRDRLERRREEQRLTSRRRWRTI